MADMKVGGEQLSREYALRILSTKADDAGDQKPSVVKRLNNLSNDSVLETANAQVIKILINALGDADVSVSADKADAGVQTDAGNDFISVAALGIDFVSSGNGDDVMVLTSQGHVDGVYGGEGNDSIAVGARRSVTVITGGAGNDTITANAKIFWYLSGGAGDDAIIATGKDVSALLGNEGDDIISAHAELVSGIYGGDGGDNITIKAKSARGIDGGEGDDTIFADIEQSLTGVYGGDGNDVIHLKADFLNHVEGGAGDDHLILESRASGSDTIYFSEGDGHDVVETNKPLHILRFNSYGTNVAEAEAAVRRNDDGTVTIEFPGGQDSITVKFSTNAVGSEVVVRQSGGRLSVSQR